jgi:hypothetical protein
MPVLRSRRAFVLALAMLSLGVGLASTHETAAAQTPAANTITTQLRPGWNLVGWMGPDTTPAALFAAIPELQTVAAWDEDAARYIWTRRGASVPPALNSVTRGQALFLWVNGPDPVRWTRPAAAEGMLLTLPAGYSLIGWAGLDGTPITEAVGRFGSALTGVSTWNAETQSYERYEPGSHEPAAGMPTLNHGDALWVELSAESRWWQSRPKRITFVRHGAISLTEEQEAQYRQELAHVQAFFLEHYGIEPPHFSVHFFHGPSHLATAGGGRISVYWPVDDPPEGVPWSHEYFHLLQTAVGGSEVGASGSPMWLIEGSATYAATLYSQARLGDRDRGFRWQMWGVSRGITALRPLEDREQFLATVGVGYNLGTLATDWLVRKADGLSTENVRFTPEERVGLDAQTKFDSYIDYFRLVGSSATWQQAFRAAFGIDVDEFYEVFEEYRIGVGVLRPPHLFDDLDEPVFVPLGDLPADTAVEVEAEFTAFQAFFSDSLGTGPAEYTVYLAADGEAARSAYLSVLNEEPDEGIDPCSGRNPWVGLVWVTPRCRHLLPGYLAEEHFANVQERIAPWESLPSVLGGHERWGPSWLKHAVTAYMTHAGSAAAGISTLEDSFAAQAPFARRTQATLRSMDTRAGLEAVRKRAREALVLLAADRLVQRAGERALFEYYRLLPVSGSWQEAFEGAFGIGVEEFYEAFEEYRSELAPPLPHLIDDSDEPVLVLLGEIPPGTTAEIRADFQSLLAFFRDRFGGGPADYTAYVVADHGSVLDLPQFEPLNGNTCVGWLPDVGLLWVLSCPARLPDLLAGAHFDAVARRLSLVPTGPAPSWLLLGGQVYAAAVNRAHRSGAEAAELSWFRGTQVNRAAQTAEPLGGFESTTQTAGAPHRVVTALSFLAADWLAQRAGEPALFDYYRLLPSSDSWREAFEGAFGMTVDGFYAAFAAYRAGGFTP